MPYEVIACQYIIYTCSSLHQTMSEVAQGLVWLTVNQALPRAGVPLAIFKHRSPIANAFCGTYYRTEEEHWGSFGKEMVQSNVDMRPLKFRRKSVWESR